MSLALSNLVSRFTLLNIEDKVFLSVIKYKSTLNPKPKLRNPTWLTKQHRAQLPDFVTPENREFLREVVQDRYSTVLTPQQTVTNKIDYQPGFRRTGLIAKKIGVYPLWLKNGKKIATTLLQILDNHVIKSYSPEEYECPRKTPVAVKNKQHCLILGAEGANPFSFTKEYCNLFKDSGVIPKRHLARFFVSSDAAIQPGTLLNAMHFPVGHYVDVRGKTIDRGFQGVMKRHGFKGMPASHGVTKTHRRGGNIGGGGEKGRVWPGTKMPGHMGNRYRVAKGLKIWRINTKYNVIWVSGQAIPGENNSIVYVYDSILPTRKPTTLPFPTYYLDDDLPEELWDDTLFNFNDPTIEFNEKK